MSVVNRKGSVEAKQRSIVMLGFSMVGKTAICFRFAKDQFTEGYTPTHENSWHRVFDYKGQQVEIIIKDTQGLSDQEIFRHEYGLGYHGYVLVYSIASRRSLETLKGIHEKLLNLTVNTNIPRVLVGNKLDLARHAREVTTAEGRALAQEWGCAFVECSAKWTQGVNEVFENLLDQIEQSSEPDHGYSTSSILNCLCCVNEHDNTEEEDSSFQVSDARRMEKWVKLLVWLTLLFGVAAIIFGMAISSVNTTSDGQLLSYICLGLGFIIALVSVLGLLGLKQNSQEFLRVYIWSQFIVVLTEITTFSILYWKMNLFRNHLTGAVLGTGAGILLQILAIVIVCSFQNALAPQLVLHTMNEPYNHVFNDYYDNMSDVY